MRAVALMRSPNLKRAHPNIYVSALAKAANAIVIERREPLPAGAIDYVIVSTMKPHRNPSLQEAIRRGIPALVVDQGYFGDRLNNPSLGWNGINGRAIRPPPGAAMRPFPVLKRWVSHRPDTGRILIPLQVPHDASVEGIDIWEWSRYKANELMDRYPDVIVEVRPHPETPEWANFDYKPILDVIRDYALVATYSSNVGVDAIRYGVPATADSPMSMINYKAHGPLWGADSWREKWAHWLSYCQWSVEELETGIALEHMMLALPEAREQSANNRLPTPPA